MFETKDRPTMQVILINVFERACVGNSHLNREVRVGLFLSYLSVQKLISPTTTHTWQQMRLQTEKQTPKTFLLHLPTHYPNTNYMVSLVTCLLRSENKVSATRCKSASTLKFLKSRATTATCSLRSKVFKMVLGRQRKW